MSRITRQQSIGQSIQDFIRAALDDRQYPADQIEMHDAFEAGMFEGPLDKEHIALGFSFDDGGRALEMGSTLREYTHRIEIFVIATTATRGENIAYAIREEMDKQGRVALKDLSQPGAPIIDWLLLDPVAIQRQPIPDPEPWEKFVWTLTCPVIDIHYA